MYKHNVSIGGQLPVCFLIAAHWLCFTVAPAHYTHLSPDWTAPPMRPYSVLSDSLEKSGGGKVYRFKHNNPNPPSSYWCECVCFLPSKTHLYAGVCFVLPAGETLTSSGWMFLDKTAKLRRFPRNWRSK